MSHRSSHRRIGAAVLLGFMIVAASALRLTAEAAQPGRDADIKIGIIGTGRIGGTLARLWANAGYSLMISSRHPGELKGLAKSLGARVRVGTPRAAAGFGDVILISVPYRALPQIGKDLSHELSGKVVIDTGNPYPERDGDMALEARRLGTGVASARYLPGVRLVRAFNAISYKDLGAQGHRAGEAYAIPLAGDDPQALAIAGRLVKAAGFDPVVVGGLDRAREFDVGTPPYVKLLTAAQLRQQLHLAPAAPTGTVAPAGTHPLPHP